MQTILLYILIFSLSPLTLSIIYDKNKDKKIKR